MQEIVSNIKGEMQRWFVLKKRLLNFESERNPKVRDVWFCFLGINIGREQNGDIKNFERPVVVLKKISRDIFLCVPLTKKQKRSIFEFEVMHKNRKSYAVISQIRVLDKKRMNPKIGVVDKIQFSGLVKKIGAFYFESSSGPEGNCVISK